jgi:effector-binding domain-containing protein
VARGSASPRELGVRIIGLLDQVWPVLRGQGVATGHNVVVYFGGSPLAIAAGVEVFSPFVATDLVRPFATPAGDAVTAVHRGPYPEIRDAYDAIERWLAANGRRAAGPSWEVYGDPGDDPAQLRTDVFFFLGT